MCRRSTYEGRNLRSRRGVEGDGPRATTRGAIGVVVVGRPPIIFSVDDHKLGVLTVDLGTAMQTIVGPHGAVEGGGGVAVVTWI